MIILALLVVVVATVTIFFAIYNGIGPLPSSYLVRKRLLDICPPHEEVVELGSGFGFVALALAKRGPVIAYENSWLPYLVLKVISLFVKNIRPRCSNFWKEDLSGHRYFVCYLYQEAMKKLPAKLPDGAFLVTHTFRVPGVQESKLVYADDLYRTPIYIYNIIARQAPSKGSSATTVDKISIGSP